MLRHLTVFLAVLLLGALFAVPALAEMPDEPTLPTVPKIPGGVEEPTRPYLPDGPTLPLPVHGSHDEVPVPIGPEPNGGLEPAGPVPAEPQLPPIVRTPGDPDATPPVPFTQRVIETLRWEGCASTGCKVGVGVVGVGAAAVGIYLYLQAAPITVPATLILGGGAALAL